jgi:rare lipoprotein A
VCVIDGIRAEFKGLLRLVAYLSGFGQRIVGAMGGLFSEIKGAGIVRTLILIACGFWLCACASTSSGSAVADRGVRDQPSMVDRSGKPLRGTMKPYQVNGRWYTPRAQPDYDETGIASWYGAAHHGRPTSTGEIFDQWAISAAHKTLPIPCVVQVTNLANGKSLRVRVNDRGPFVDGRIIDLSHGAAERLGFDRQGVTRVRVRYVGPG